MTHFSTEDLMDGMVRYQIPEYMRPGILRWIEEGIIPGGFLTAVIENNLRESFDKADDQNMFRIHSYLLFFYNCAPAPCWGSIKKVKEWANKGGLKEKPRYIHPIEDDDIEAGE
jgi:hypothetical protein